MTIEGRVLKPANENPWYVLMTLYGEQDGKDVDWDLHDRNRAAWNAWSCQAMSGEARAVAAKPSIELIAELSGWPTLRAEVTQRHKFEMLLRNGKGFAYPGLPDVAGIVDMRSVAFTHHLVMDEAVFSGDASFYASMFEGDVLFTDSVFNGDAKFIGASFGGKGAFDSVTFGSMAWFSEAEFSKDASFSLATFIGEATFYSATFSSAVGFASATFNGIAGFHSATFKGDAWFGGVTFSGDAGFRSVKFGGFVYFPEAGFGTKGGGQEVIFTDTQFAKPTNFRDAKFEASYPDFSGAVLHDKTAFTDDKKNWPTGAQAHRAQAKASCAVIRHNLGKQGLPEAEHFFFRREMGFAGQIGGFWERLPYRLFGWVSDYGYSILTPFLWLCLLIVGGGYALAYGVAGSAAAVTYEQGLGLSFANVFNFLAFHKTFATEDFMAELPSWLKAFSGFQSIAGVVLLFFLGLGLRTRFRMR